jgi:hypothetical protein
MSIAQTISLPQVSGETASTSTVAQSSFWTTFRGLVWKFLVDIGRHRGEHAMKHGHY